MDSRNLGQLSHDVYRLFMCLRTRESLAKYLWHEGHRLLSEVGNEAGMRRSSHGKRGHVSPMAVQRGLNIFFSISNHVTTVVPAF